MKPHNVLYSEDVANEQAVCVAVLIPGDIAVVAHQSHDVVLRAHQNGCQNNRVTLTEVVGKIRDLRANIHYVRFSSGLNLVGLRFGGIVSKHRCTLSDRAWKPVESRNHRSQHWRSFRTRVCVMAAVRGTPSGVPVSLTPGFQPAYSCHPFAWKRKVAAN